MDAIKGELLLEHMRDLEELFSAFRQRFHLQDKDYLCNKGLNTILNHADYFISKRLAPALPTNDGKQNPSRVHHPILSDNETAYICAVLEHWLRKEFNAD